MKRIAFGLGIFITCSDFTAVCQQQQSEVCQDYSDTVSQLAIETATIRATMATLGLSQQVMQTTVNSYITDKMQVAASKCSQSTSSTTPVAPQPSTASGTSGSTVAQQNKAGNGAKQKPTPKAPTRKPVATLSTPTPQNLQVAPPTLPTTKDESSQPLADASPILNRTTPEKPISNSILCPNNIVDTTMDKPTLSSATSPDNGQIVLTTPKSTKSTQVQVCADDGTQIVAPTTMVADATGNVTLTGMKLTTGQKVLAQFIAPRKNGNAPSFGPASDEILVDSCSKAVSDSTIAAPTLSVSIATDANNKANYSGTGPKSGSVRICVKDLPIDPTNAHLISVGTDGTFKGTDELDINANDQIQAQTVSITSKATKYGPLSDPKTVTALLIIGSPSDGNNFVGTFIGGVEQSGYSSLGNNTGAFISAYLRNPYRPLQGTVGFALWGRVRLLSAPQPSTENGISTILTNPTGTLQTTSYASIGTAVDYVAGPELRLKEWPASNGNLSRISLIAGAGATTPLNSNNVEVTYNVPAPNTQECIQLVQQFGQSSGHVPYLVADPNSTDNSCIYNPVSKTPYKFVSFANQNRTDFLFKWGVGGRLTHVWPAKDKTPSYTGSLDLTVGQDASVTGGETRNWVFKADSVYPLTLLGTSYLYVFGGAEMRFIHNKTYPPLILSAGTMVPTIPDPSVIVLPLKQPNRDFYRLGFGLNLSSIWCKLGGAGCASGNTAGDTTAAATDSTKDGSAAKTETASNTGTTTKKAK